MIISFLFLTSIQTSFAVEDVDPSSWSVDWETGEIIVPYVYTSVKEIKTSTEPDFYVLEVSLEADDVLASWDAVEDILFIQYMIVSLF